MMPSRTRSEVRSQDYLKFDPGASTLDKPPPPWEAQRRPRIELPSVAFSCFCGGSVMPSARLLACMCAQFRTGQVGCALRCFSPGFLFSLFDSVWRPWLFFIDIEMNSVFDCAFLFCLRHTLMSTDGITLGFLYDEGKSCFVFRFRLSIRFSLR